jgi:hypothetical protein
MSIPHFTLGTAYDSNSPLQVTLLNLVTGQAFQANIFCEGGYDSTIMEGSLVGDDPEGMFLGTSSRDAYGLDRSGNWRHDTDCIWNHISWRGDADRLPTGNYKILLPEVMPKGVHTQLPGAHDDISWG